MRIGRTLPPAAAPIYAKDIIDGLKGLVRPNSELRRFEAELKRRYGAGYGFLLSSGRAALHVILSALHRLCPERDTVIIPAFVCYSVPAAVVKSGLKIKLCDLDRNSMGYDYEELEKIIRNDSESQGEGKILAVVQVHFFGLASNTSRLKDLVGKCSGIAVIEDAAQALGAVHNGKMLGKDGDVGFFSLGRGKVMSTVEGGIILTDRDDIAEAVTKILEDVYQYTAYEIIQLIVYACFLAIFQHPLFFWFPKSLPFLKIGHTIYDPDFEIKKMSGFQAGLAKNWEVKTRRFQARRKVNAQRLKAELSSLKINGYESASDNAGNLIRYPVRMDNVGNINRLLEAGAKTGLGIATTYPDTINNIPELRRFLNGERYPNAKAAVEKVVTLPVHPFVTKRDVMKIAALISKDIESCGRT